MNDKIKQYLGWVGLIALVVVTLAIWRGVGAYARSIQPSNFRSFAVSGEGRTVIVPDIAQFSFGVTTEGGTDIGKLQTDNTTKINKAIEFVKSKGIDAKDIKTSQYNLSPRYQNVYCGQRVGMMGPEVCPPASIVGYTVDQTVTVKIRQDNFAKIGEVLTGLVSAGANNVSQLNFTLDDPAAAESTARAEAIKEAQAKAKAVAKAAGVGLGQLLSIDESGYIPFAAKDMYYSERAVGMSAAAPAPAIEPGSQEVRVSVTLRYEIE